MSDEQNSKGKDISPEMRRAVSRRNFLTTDLKGAGMKAVKQMPAFGGLLGAVMRETGAQREERLVENLWLLLMNRKPKPEESGAGLDLVKQARTADEKGDALVDILWALTRTREFEDLNRSNTMLIRGLYRIAQDREPSEAEKQAALDVIREAVDSARRTIEEAEEDSEAAGLDLDTAATVARLSALEGLFTGLLRSAESVLRNTPTPMKRSFFG